MGTNFGGLQVLGCDGENKGDPQPEFGVEVKENGGFLCAGSFLGLEERKMGIHGAGWGNNEGK